MSTDLTETQIKTAVLEKRLDTFECQIEKLDEKVTRIESKVQNLEVKVAVWAAIGGMVVRYLPDIASVVQAAIK